MDANKKFQQVIQTLIHKAIDVDIVSEIALEKEQLQALQSLNEYCVHQVLNDTEVVYDPRKINYKTNQELKAALIAMLLCQSLTNPARKTKENKEYFEENIIVFMQDEHTKVIGFGDIPEQNVEEAIYENIIEDWKIYRDKSGLGILALIDEKTKLTGIDNYQRGGDPLYEFARFHRKYTEKEKAKEEKRRESAQEAFRNALVQSLALEVSKQQLLAGKDPLELIDSLFNNTGQQKKLKSNEPKIDRQIENNITKLLEHTNNRDDKSRER